MAEKIYITDMMDRDFRKVWDNNYQIRAMVRGDYEDIMQEALDVVLQGLTDSLVRYLAGTTHAEILKGLFGQPSSKDVVAIKDRLYHEMDSVLQPSDSQTFEHFLDKVTELFSNAYIIEGSYVAFVDVLNKTYCYNSEM